MKISKRAATIAIAGALMLAGATAAIAETGDNRPSIQGPSDAPQQQGDVGQANNTDEGQQGEVGQANNTDEGQQGEVGQANNTDEGQHGEVGQANNQDTGQQGDVGSSNGNNG